MNITGSSPPQPAFADLAAQRSGFNARSAQTSEPNETPAEERSETATAEAQETAPSRAGSNGNKVDLFA